ncbi:MAG TPA: helix-turn-helix domain-containing protein [Pseudonocardiaceae bacterium]
MPTPARPPGSAEHRPLRRDAERNRLRILEAAGEVFAQRGLEASLDEIAEHAGVGVGTVYRRFPGKDELVEALFEQKIARVEALAEQAAAIPDGWQALASFLESALALQVADLGLRQVLLSHGCGRDRVAGARARLAPLIGNLVCRAQSQGGMRTDVELPDIPAILLMITSVAEYSRGVNEDLWRRYLALILDGLRAGPQHGPLPADALSQSQLDQVMRSWDPVRRHPPS